MLLRRNKGSILIMSLITFSIISLICMTCCSLVLSNNRINDLEYKSEKLREENLGIIELIKSEILEEINYAVENTKTEYEFYNFVKKNDFIEKVKNIDNVKSKSIEFVYNEKFSNKEFIHYDIRVKSQINNYKKYSYIKLKIQNPWFNITKDTNKKKDKIEDSKKDDREEVSDLITFYNYEEG